MTCRCGESLCDSCMSQLPRLINDELLRWSIERGAEGDVGVGGFRFGPVEPRPGGRFRIPFEGTASYTSARVEPFPPYACSGWIEVDRSLAVHGLALGNTVIREEREGPRSGESRG